jgi:hypothetical protein
MTPTAPNEPLTPEEIDYSQNVVTPPSMAGVPLTTGEVDGLRKYAKHPSNLLARCVATIDALRAENAEKGARIFQLDFDLTSALATGGLKERTIQSYANENHDLKMKILEKDAQIEKRELFHCEQTKLIATLTRELDECRLRRRRMADWNPPVVPSVGTGALYGACMSCGGWLPPPSAAGHQCMGRYAGSINPSVTSGPAPTIIQTSGVTGPFLHAECERLFAAEHERAERLAKKIERIVELVDQQAEDEGLWFIGSSRTMPEAYLQRELRRLHALIEAIACGEEKSA